MLSHRRRFVTDLIWSSGSTRAGHHGKYHRFFSQSVWELDVLSRLLAKRLIRLFAPTGIVRLAVENRRQFGGPWLALELVKRRGLDEFLREAMPPGCESVPWSLTALRIMGCHQRWMLQATLDERAIRGLTSTLQPISGLLSLSREHRPEGMRMASGHTGNVVPGNRLRVRVPCPPLL